MDSFIRHITDLQDQILEAKDLSLLIMVEKRGTDLEIEFISVIHSLATALQQIQHAKEKALEGE